MGHELTINAGGAEMAYAGAVPWHGLGQQLDPDAPVQSWIKAAGMEWVIQRSTVEYKDRHGVPRRFEGQEVLYRSDTGAPLGVVSEGYHQVEPHQVVEFFAELVDTRGWKLETAGTLFGGRKFWALARICADQPVLDPRDKVGKFLLLSTTADGSAPTSATETEIRVVCNNTITAAERRAAKASWTHRSKWDPVLARQQLDLVGANEATDTFARTMEVFRKLAERSLRPTERDDLTLRLYGLEADNMTAEGKQKAFSGRGISKVRSLARGDGLIGEELDGCAFTSWSWLNAVTQHADHNAQARSQSHRLDSAWFGRGADRKRRALELALETVA